MALGAQSKTAVSEYALSNGVMPNNATDAGLSVGFSTDYISGLSFTRVSDSVGQVVITLNSLGSGVNVGDTLIFEGTKDTTGVHWTCTGGTLLDRFRPQECR